MLIATPNRQASSFAGASAVESFQAAPPREESSAITPPPSPNRNEAFTKSLPYLTENDFQLILSKAKLMTFRAGDAIIRQSAPSPAFFMIRSGKVRIERNGVSIATLAAGAVIGEMTLLESSSSSASVIAAEEVTVDSIALDDIREIFVTFPHLGSRFYRSIALNLSRKLRDTSGQLSSLLAKP